MPLPEWSLRHLAGYFPIAMSSFHVWLSQRLSAFHQARGQKLCVLAPRGAAKSTWSTLAYPLYVLLHGLEPYVIVTSDTGKQAEKFMDAIKIELETNESLQAAYPALARKGPVWRADQIRLANDCVVEALGTGAKVRGRKNRSRRPSLIIVDDPQNLEHITSQIQRERSWEWLNKDVCNAGDPDTNIIVLGTALHRECIVCQLQHTPGWKTELFRSITQWPARMDLWAQWEQILHDWQDDEREEKARAFYETNAEAMQA